MIWLGWINKVRKKTNTREPKETKQLEEKKAKHRNPGPMTKYRGAMFSRRCISFMNIMLPEWISSN